MVFGMSLATYTLIHVIISLIGIGAFSGDYCIDQPDWLWLSL
jgi:hypothetical protein